MALRRYGRVWLVALTMLVAMALASVARGANYIVLYRAQGVPANAATSIQQAGGTLVYGYNQIGVAIASSTSSTFRANLLKSAAVQNGSSTPGFGAQLA